MVRISPFEEKYKKDVQQVCLNTGPAEALTDKKTADFILNTFCNYYVEKEPENVYVLVDDNDRGQGYIFCAENFRKYLKGFKSYLPIIKSTGKENYIEALAELFGTAFFSLWYPAHMHIDLNEGFRGSGNGSRMVQTLLSSLRSKGIKGVMLIVGTGNTEAQRFYNKNGFKKIVSFRDGTVMAQKLK